MQATAPVEDWIDVGLALDDEAGGQVGFVIETELATVEEDAFIDKVVDAD